MTAAAPDDRAAVAARFEGTWLLVHHHAEELTDGGAA